MKWYPISKKKQKKICHCTADRSEITAVLRPQGQRPGRMIRHYRDDDSAIRWHWDWQAARVVQQ